MNIILNIDNNRTEIEADSMFLELVDKELRYPSSIAQYQTNGISIPSDEGWDGWIRCLHRRKASPWWFPTGLLLQVCELAKRAGRPVQIYDKRVRPEPGFPELVNIPLRDYQRKAVQAAVRAGRGVLDMPPRSGKTRTMCEIVRQIALPTIWMAPTDRIVDQTHKVLAGFFGDDFVTHLVGSGTWEQAARTPVVICTAATAVRLPEAFYQTRQCVAIDEFHHSSAISYKQILDKCPHIYYRFGMTGTFFRSGEDAMAMHGLLSNTIFKVSSEELLKSGNLVPTYVCFVPVLSPKLRNLGSTTFQSGHGKQGIHEHVGRNQLVAFCALALVKVGRKVLILVGTKKQGRLIQEILLNFLKPNSEGPTQFKPVEFVSTDVRRGVQGRMLDSFEAGQEVKVLIGTTLLGEGVDLPSTDALVYARGEQAEVGLTQSAYRVSTAVAGKKDAIIFDFADRHNRKLLAHSQERLKVYFSEATYHVTVLQNPEKVKDWIKSVLQLPVATL